MLWTNVTWRVGSLRRMPEMAILIPSDRDIRPIDPSRYGRHLSPSEQVQERLLTATPLTQRQLNVAVIDCRPGGRCRTGGLAATPF